jgi:hypothetical protein
MLATSQTGPPERPAAARVSGTERCHGSPATSTSDFTRPASSGTISRAVPRAAPFASSMTVTKRDRSS